MGDMFQKKMNSLSDMPSVFGIPDDILISGIHELGRNQDVTSDRVL